MCAHNGADKIEPLVVGGKALGSIVKRCGKDGEMETTPHVVRSA